jgi:hypothetical protein
VNKHSILGLSAVMACTMLVQYPEFCSAEEGDATVAEGEVESLSRQRLTSRATKRWAALIDGDLKVAYEFESPGYRGTVSYDDFAAQFGDAIRWQEAEVRSVDLREQGTVAQVGLFLRYTAPSVQNEKMPMARGITETWIKSAGTWWFLRE